MLSINELYFDTKNNWIFFIIVQNAEIDETNIIPFVVKCHLVQTSFLYFYYFYASKRFTGGIQWLVSL